MIKFMVRWNRYLTLLAVMAGSVVSATAIGEAKAFTPPTPPELTSISEGGGILISQNQRQKYFQYCEIVSDRAIVYDLSEPRRREAIDRGDIVRLVSDQFNYYGLDERTIRAFIIDRPMQGLIEATDLNCDQAVPRAPRVDNNTPFPPRPDYSNLRYCPIRSENSPFVEVYGSPADRMSNSIIPANEEVGIDLQRQTTTLSGVRWVYLVARLQDRNVTGWVMTNQPSSYFDSDCFNSYNFPQ